MISSQLGELSFMHIYSQRAQVPGSIIIDGMLRVFCIVISHEECFIFYLCVVMKVVLDIVSLVGASMLHLLDVLLLFW